MKVQRTKFQEPTPSKAEEKTKSKVEKTRDELCLSLTNERSLSNYFTKLEGKYSTVQSSGVKDNPYDELESNLKSEVNAGEAINRGEDTQEAILNTDTHTEDNPKFSQ